MNGLRQRLLIDLKVQGAITRRFLLYWFYCVLTATLLLFFWRVLAGPEAPAHEHLFFVLRNFGPAAIVAVAVLPVVLYDVLRLTNRFAGPIYRLRRGLDELADGRTVRPLRFRKEDFWHDLADKYNSVAARLNQLEATKAEPEPRGETCPT